MAADAWPAFRGPNSGGVSESAVPPWRIGPTNGVLWSVEMPGSPSSPCVVDGRIFLTTLADGKLETRAYSAQNGQLLWRRVAPAEQLEAFHPNYGSPATATPATDGRRVVSYFGSSGLFCYDMAGKELWRHRLPMAKTHANFGSGTSPLLADGRVILNRDLMGGSSLIAFDLQDGHQLWEAPRPDCSTSYGSPILWDHGRAADVVLTGSLCVRGYDLLTGAENWRVQGLSAGACTTPVLGGGMLYTASWAPGKSDAPFPTWKSIADKFDKNHDNALSEEEMQGEGAYLKAFDFDKNGKLDQAEWDSLLAGLQRGENCLVAVQPGARGDATATHVAWKAVRGLPYVPSPLYYEGCVYLVKDGGLLSSFNARTGEPAYVEARLKDASGSYYASPVAADGRIYVASMKGMLTVVKAGGPQPEILRQADFGEPIDATPALVGHRLYLRTHSKLMAFADGVN
jgi:outer membrane protein assembly factor BamB